MILFVALTLISTSLAADDLGQILKSPKATLTLYSNFKAGAGLKYSGAEDRMRFRLFRKNAEFVADLKDHEDTATFGLNFFSPLTSDEKKQYLGLNITDYNPQPGPLGSKPSLVAAPAEKLWTNVGGVTKVKNQGSCGSCWTFAAVGGLETRYQQGSGKLRNFAEQEYLDCVYEGQKDGCAGGWPDRAYDYSRKNGGRLAATASYRYAAKDGRCLKGSKPNAMVAMKINGYVSVGRTEAANIEALVSGSLSVAFEVTNYFQQYTGGIMKDTTCSGRINHGVTAVGYTAKFVLVKNSWGSNWGDNGFVKFARGHDNCQLFKYASYPKLSKTGKHDSTPSDTATTYRPSKDDDMKPKPKPKPKCVDVFSSCHKYPEDCKLDYMRDWVEKWCAKFCKFCDEDGDDSACPSGTIRCSDGVCRHEHMCH